MCVKLLTEHHLKCLSLKGGCTGLSESTLIKMPHGWKSHVTAHTFLRLFQLPDEEDILSSPEHSGRSAASGSDSD